MSRSKWQALLALANSGNSEAEWQVADLYGDGCMDHKRNILVKRSAQKSAQWMRRAAEHGNRSAQIALGVLLGNGDGLAKNVEESLLWLKKAFHAGDLSPAAHNVAITYREIGNLKMAVQWFQKAADAGDDDALVQLGIHYYWGKGVKKDPEAAIRCFRKATKGKNISGFGRDDAFFCLALGYFEGQGVKKSIQTARKLLHRANIDNDHPAAHKMLVKLTSTG